MSLTDPEGFKDAIMRGRKITPTELAPFIAANPKEGQLHDYKNGKLTHVTTKAEKEAGQRTIKEWVTAFANAEGGVLLIGPEDAWDSLAAKLDAEGRFDVVGIPPGRLSVSLQVPGYVFSTENKSLDAFNPFRLQGTIDADVTDLRVLMEPVQPRPAVSGEGNEREAAKG